MDILESRSRGRRRVTLVVRQFEFTVEEMHTPFRSPVFPVVFKGESSAVCATTLAELDSYVECNASVMPDECELIDSRWEGWLLYPKDALLLPSILKRRYTKREFLLFCGASEQQLSITNLNKYSREDVFAFVLQQAQRMA